jgi:hypothetical protein
MGIIMGGFSMQCRHHAEKDRCVEVCSNNPLSRENVRRAEAALKSKSATHQDWLTFANLFESLYQFEKAEVCARYALLNLSGFGTATKHLKPSVSKIVKYRLSSKHLEGAHPLRVRAALEDATEALYGLFGELSERDQKLSKPAFKNLRDSLRDAISLTAYSGAEATAKLARLFRGSNDWNPSRLDMPELALHMCMTELEENPEDPDLLLVSATVCNDLELWPKAIQYGESALTFGAKPKYVYPVLIKALMQNREPMRAWELLGQTPITKENKSNVLAQKIICLYYLQSAATEEDEQSFIRDKRHEFAEELREFEENALNPHVVKHQALNHLIDTYEYGKAWLYLEELEREKWKGNLQIWRQRVINGAALHGIDLDSEIVASQTNNLDAFPDADD